MSRVAIIGAGIAGPAAALTLAQHGHTVDVYERRNESDLHSFGVIGITNENWNALTELGMVAHEYNHSYSVYGGDTTEWNGHYVEWTNLHNALITAARTVGAAFHFGTEYDYNDFSQHDYVVVAAGVGFAGHVSTPDYSGYVVYRGLSNLPTDYDWLSVSDAEKRWNFKLAHTDNGAAWELYSHLPKPRPMGTTTIDAINPAAYDGLPAEFIPFITNSKEMFRAAISDWDVPESMFISWHTVSIGDANGAMRPHTGMGANLGISEALSLPDMFGLSHRVKMTTDQTLLIKREIQRTRGIEMGRAALGV